MAQVKIQPSFASGEISPSLWGRVDFAKFHVGAATLRNFFVDFRGGASTRPGTKYSGASLTAGSSATPPRLIPFVFNVQADQAYALELGDYYMRVIDHGSYVTETGVAITGVSNSSPATITFSGGHSYSPGDWLYFSDVGGATAINGQTYIVASTTPTTLTLKDAFGSIVSSLLWSPYTSGGAAYRIYTLDTPWSIADIALLKFDQSADVMSICRQNYPPYDLARLAANSWTVTQTTFAANISAPASGSCSSQTSASPGYSYQYLVTAVSQDNQESVASPYIEVNGAANISTTSNTISITWAQVTGASAYNIYKTPQSYAWRIPAGARFGFMASTTGTSYNDTNITPDYTKSPPLHLNPFAQSSIQYITVTGGGSGYHQATTTLSIASATGSGAVLLPIISNAGSGGGVAGSGGGSDAVGPIIGVIIQNPGQGYQSTDAITATDTNVSPGSGATFSMKLNPATGTWPGVVSYFQQRRVYASSANDPDTYWMSKPGAYTNFDQADPVTDGDSIQGSPWARQVNALNWLVPMPGGLVVLTGRGAWQVSGNGTKGSAITPASQDAQPQAYYGCSSLVPPLVINYDVLYVSDGEGTVYDLSYNFFTQIYTGQDITILSTHLLRGKKIVSWCLSNKPHKLIWVVLDDGSLLSLTFLKEQEIQGWARHDTNGQVVSVTSVPENGLDIVYLVVRRLINGQWMYYIERMDDRQWDGVETCWAVDAGLNYGMNYPAAQLTASAASGTIALTASAGVFSAGDVGSVIRMGGGVMTVASYVSATQVTATTSSPILRLIPNDPNKTPLPAASGKWTMAAPVSVISGLGHLEGVSVAILADGSVQNPRTVVDGAITLDAPCSMVTVGLGFQCQLQSLYLDAEGSAGTIQGKRKDLYAATVRMANSRGLKVGSNQTDMSTQPSQDIQTWTGLIEFKERGLAASAGVAFPLYTGDRRCVITPGWDTRGQLCIQQDYPLPATISAIIPEFEIGDDSG